MSETSMNGQLIATPIAISLDRISLIVYEAIVAIQAQQPDYVVEKYRKTSFQQHRSSLINRLQSVLGQTIDRETLFAKLKQFLQALLIPSFFESAAYRNLLARVDDAAAPQVHSLAPDVRVEPIEKHDSRIAVLLLDAENLKLTAKAESLLTDWCSCPIHIKIAFANWKTMGRWDGEFHRRGYQMIHVPQGKNSADMEMTAVGSSILAQHPTVKEVIVGATDRDLNHLKNRLQTQGLVVYSVSKHGRSITIVNQQTGKAETYANDGDPEPIEIPTKDELLDSLKTLIEAEQTATRNPWVRLARLSQLFLKEHDLTVREVITALSKSDRSVKDFLSDYPHDFVIHQPIKNAALYISLFQEDPRGVQLPPAQATAPATNLPATDSPVTKLPPVANGAIVPHAAPPLKFDSSETLSAYLVLLLRHLLDHTGNDYVAIGELGSTFNKHYGKSITTALKEVKRTGSYVKYLQTESAFKLKQVRELWFVTLTRR